MHPTKAYLALSMAMCAAENLPCIADLTKALEEFEKRHQGSMEEKNAMRRLLLRAIELRKCVE